MTSSPIMMSLLDSYCLKVLVTLPKSHSTHSPVDASSRFSAFKSL